jgi:general secretion pathway protein K
MRARLRALLNRRVSRRRGVALVVVIVTAAVLAAVMTELMFNSSVDLEGAASARDMVRAEYLARSAINLGRLAIKTQALIDQNLKNPQAAQFAGAFANFQLADVVPMLAKLFGGESDERAGLTSMFGIEPGSLKGLGVGPNATFDLQMVTEDGKLNLNCGAGLNDQPRQAILYGMLSALFYPPRYNPIFEAPDPDGQYMTRDDVARAIIDWADIDDQRYSPDGKSGGAEDYRYDVGKDPYRAHNHRFDTVEEVNLVRGMGDELWGHFGEMLTVYGGCKINLNALKPEHWPLMAAIIRATVKDDQKQNPVLLDDALLGQVAQQLTSMSQMMGGFQNVQQFVTLVSNPAQALQTLGGTGSGSGSGSSSSSNASTPGIALDPVKVGNVATVGPRRLWRLDATGTIKRTARRKIEVHIRAVWDTMHFNQNTTGQDPNDRMGTWVYWRQD